MFVSLPGKKKEEGGTLRNEGSTLITDHFLFYQYAQNCVKLYRMNVFRCWVWNSFHIMGNIASPEIVVWGMHPIMHYTMPHASYAFLKICILCEKNYGCPLMSGLSVLPTLRLSVHTLVLFYQPTDLNQIWEEKRAPCSLIFPSSQVTCVAGSTAAGSHFRSLPPSYHFLPIKSFISLGLVCVLKETGCTWHATIYLNTNRTTEPLISNKI